MRIQSRTLRTRTIYFVDAKMPSGWYSWLDLYMQKFSNEMTYYSFKGSIV